MILFIECVVLCLLFFIMVTASYKKNPLAGLHNLPRAIQERVQELPEYEGARPEKILSAKERIVKKLPALVVLLGLFVGIVYLAGARTFLSGLLYSFIIWVVIKLFVVFVIDILWYSNSPERWIKGTEDMAGKYKNYRFYMSSIPRSLAAGLIVSVFVGLIIMAIC